MTTVYKKEEICREVLENYYNKKFPNINPNFLKNPESGRNLQLDGYNQELNIAFEYNGEQHYIWPNYFHKSKDEFISQLKRDKFKYQRCEEEGVYLIIIPYTVPVDEISGFIKEKLP